MRYVGAFVIGLVIGCIAVAIVAVIVR